LILFVGSLKFAGMQPRYQQTVHPVRRQNSDREDMAGKPFPPVSRHWTVCLLLILALLTTCLLRASGREHGVPITRNGAWNDLLDQLDAGRRTNASNESVASDLLLIQKFLKEHETEVNVALYDVTVFRAIDHLRAHFQKADKDLETIREALSYKEFQARSVR
jgi:hypothetical protein